MSTKAVNVSLSTEDVTRLIEALDAHEYWQRRNVLPRNNGVVSSLATLSRASIATGTASGSAGNNATPSGR